MIGDWCQTAISCPSYPPRGCEYRGWIKAFEMATALADSEPGLSHCSDSEHDDLNQSQNNWQIGRGYSITGKKITNCCSRFADMVERFFKFILCELTDLD